MLLFTNVFGWSDVAHFLLGLTVVFEGVSGAICVWVCNIRRLFAMSFSWFICS